jgi:NitT/TauT family transport system substrate-binding protein
MIGAEMRRLKWIVMVLVAGLLATGLVACGGDDVASEGTSSGAPEATTLTVATPFPSGLAFPELFVAIARKNFDDENLTIEVEPLDGSGSTLQALATGQVDVAVPSPGPIMQAAQRGGTPLSIYTSYQRGIFSLITSPETGVRSLEDLEGKTIGVGALDSGEVPVVKAMLATVGLEEGDGYKLLAVGDGGTASAALQRGEIAAYGAAFVDILILEGSGAELIDLSPEGFQGGTDTHYVVSKDMRDSDPDVIVRFGRALAEGAAWLHENPDQALDLICDRFPEECEDREFAQQLLDAVLELQKLPPSADGQWGYTDMDAIQEFGDMLFEQGELQAKPDVSQMFTDEFVPDFNKTSSGG